MCSTLFPLLITATGPDGQYKQDLQNETALGFIHHAGNSDILIPWDFIQIIQFIGERNVSPVSF